MPVHAEVAELDEVAVGLNTALVPPTNTTAECTLGILANLASRGQVDDDGLLLVLVKSPGLTLMADLGRLASHSHDLALDPWLREHCRTTVHKRPWCIGAKFDEVVQAQRPHWLALGDGLYRNLRPNAPGPQLAVCHAVSRDLETFVSVVGSHSGLSIAVATAFAAAIREVGQEVRLAYFGHWAWCQNVGNCEEPLAQVFQTYQQDWAETDAEKNALNFELLLGELGHFLGGMASRVLLASDMLLCTRPFLFCWLLRRIWPSSTAQLPMLHYYSGPLLFDTPANIKAQVLNAFRRTVLESDLDIVVASSVLQSAWMIVMAGVAVPHVRPHAAQLRGLYKAPAATPVEIKALVLRSTWVSSLMGESFRAMLDKIRSESSLSARVRIDWLAGVKFLPYEDIAKFDAAIFLPEQPDKLTFWEQYEMAMPLWLPSVDFWVRIHAIGEYRYSVFAHIWEAGLPDGIEASMACGMPTSLFFHGSSIEELHLDSPVAPAMWFHLTDYVIFPNLQLFASAADLIVQLLAADLSAISQRMETFNRHTWQASAAFYRTAFCVMGAGRALYKGPATPLFLPQPSSAAAWSRVCSP